MTRSAVVIGAPTDFGANRRGVDMGPSAIRYAGLADQLADAGVECVDVGNVTAGPMGDGTTDPEGDTDPLANTRQACERLAERIRSESGPDRIPLVLGGDHSISIGSMHGVTPEESMGVVWFDAHADFNTPETSPSGNVHGMVLAAILGHGSFGQAAWATIPQVRPENVVLVGTRDVDRPEAEALRESAVTVMTMADIDTHGIADVCERAIARASEGVEAVHVSLDLDFLDPLEAPGVGTPARGGATYREAHLAMEVVANDLCSRDKLAGMDLVEVNPIRDQVNETAELATELAASAFGKRIF